MTTGVVPEERAVDRGRPRNVVALGGGTGLPAVLRGLKTLMAGGNRTALTAVVTMTDDGGSSGRLRTILRVPPPGDIRNCLVALSEEEDLLGGLFQHRYRESGELTGHAVGNLILAALAEQTGSFLKAVELSSRVLRTVGRILPATLNDVRLEADFEDGSHVCGETEIASSGKPIRRVMLNPRDVRPTPGVLESIRDADLVVLGPGSLYTSVVPNLLVTGVVDALRESAAPVVLVANLASERNETAGLGLTDHLAIVEEHAGKGVIHAVLAHEGVIEETTLDRYKAEGAAPLTWPDEDSHQGVRVLRKNLLGDGPKLRHDADATAEGLFALWQEFAVATETPRQA